MKAIRLSAVAGAAVVLSSSLLSQVSRNVDLLANIRPASSSRTDYSDIWGYRNPANGKEYALLLSEDGTHIIDCSDPRNPVQRGLIRTERSGSSNIWRDCKTYGPYAYVVSEAYGGIQIIDLTDPDNPTRVKHWGSSMWSNTHNVALDEATGLLYCMGTNSGTHVIDVKTDPVNPNRIYRLSSPYMHDGSVRNGYAYMADQNGNKLRIYDVTQLPNSMPELSEIRMPGSQIAHATWSTRDDNYCVTANESSGGPVGVFDVSNKRLPNRVATYKANASSAPSAVPHNVFVEDRILHVSHYTEGYRVLDLTDPANPLEVGYYDTYSGFSGGYDGCWGVYHQMPSGIIYASDFDRGLFILKPKATPVRYGDVSPGSTGNRPSIHTFGVSYLGNPRFRIDAENATPNAPGAFFLGTTRGSFPIFGIDVLVGLAPAPVSVSIATDAQGNVSIPLGILNDPTLAGTLLTTQFISSTAPRREISPRLRASSSNSSSPEQRTEQGAKGAGVACPPSGDYRGSRPDPVSRQPNAMRLSVALGALSLLSSSLFAQQSRNVELLANERPPLSFGNDYADIWGYRNFENGKEYALLLSGNGTHIYDCTDPRNPVLRGVIPSENPGSYSNLWQTPRRSAPTPTWRRKPTAACRSSICATPTTPSDSSTGARHCGSTRTTSRSTKARAFSTSPAHRAAPRSSTSRLTPATHA